MRRWSSVAGDRAAATRPRPASRGRAGPGSGHFRIDLGAGVEPCQLGAAVDVMQAVPGKTSAPPAQPAQRREARPGVVPQPLQLLGQWTAEGDLGDTVADFARRARRPFGEQRVDLHENHVARGTGLDSAISGGLALNPPSQYGVPSISTAWCNCGRQAEARTTSTFSSGLRKIRARPVVTSVAAMNGQGASSCAGARSRPAARAPDAVGSPPTG